jgi:hypothetical protein
VKHCFLCRWSFGTTEFSPDDELTPILKCHPGGDEKKEKMAMKVCRQYDAEDTTGEGYEQ